MAKGFMGAVIAAGLLAAGCTANERAKTFGGIITVELAAGEQLVQATWKNSDLWYLTTVRAPEVAPRTYTFREQSSYGIWEGTVIFVEK